MRPTLTKLKTLNEHAAHRGIIVSDKSPRLDSALVERNRRLLTKLREQLKHTSDAAEAEEVRVNRDSQLQSQEYEDDAQRLDSLDREGNLVGRDVARLVRVERALKKIDEGTYGFSDVSGQRIPDDRLEAMPDAINTLSEQDASERLR
jgi:DnaK suppressor protein